MSLQRALETLSQLHLSAEADVQDCDAGRPLVEVYDRSGRKVDHLLCPSHRDAEALATVINSIDQLREDQ